MNKYPLMKGPNIIKRNFTFTGYLTAGEFWSEIGMRIISLLCAVIVTCILISVCLPGTSEDKLAVTNIVTPLLALVWFIPMICMTRRRLRDAGHSAKSYLWLLLPVIGWLIFLGQLCGKSIPREQPKIKSYY